MKAIHPEVSNYFYMQLKVSPQSVMHNTMQNNKK